MYIRNSICFNVRTDLQDEDLKFLCAEISKPKVKPFLISTWYRPPNSSINLFEKVQLILDKIEFLDTQNIIIGDLNCNLMPIGAIDNNTKHLLELSESYQYTQLIKEPTRTTNNSSTLIDLFLTEPKKITSRGVVVLGISDHNFIDAIKKHASEKSKPITTQSHSYRQCAQCWFPKP